MQVHKILKDNKIILLIVALMMCMSITQAQVSSVEFGRNRIQYQKFKWEYYQTQNFNSYFYQNGEELAKFVAQVAEDELLKIEKEVEYTMQRRTNIVVYNTFNDMKESNIGLGSDWQSAGGTTKLVNNKIIVYFNGNHADLRKQIREGIAKVLTQNILFGDDLGEVASNQALLDLPQWLVDGYIAYQGENWSTQLDDDLKSEILSGKYKSFYQFAFDKPLLAGHAFWYFIEEKYKKESTTYLLYLARVYKNLNKASETVTKIPKFKDLLASFMEYQDEKYTNDIRRRKFYPKGSEVTSVDIDTRTDYFNFNVNPNKRNGSFAVIQYKKGQYRLIFNDGDKDRVLLKFGARTKIVDRNPNYPLMAWDPKGNRLSVVYEDQAKLKLFVYDVISDTKPIHRELNQFFDQVQDIKYLYKNDILLLSAVKNGHSDIYTYDIENEKIKQITNDVFDDLDPSFVSLQGKTGILFSSNRPNANAQGGDTSLLKNNFNIFLLTGFESDQPKDRKLTQLSNLKFGNARFPSQYTGHHFTFVSDENGIGNRYAGFLSTQSAGMDTVVIIGDDILRNPTKREVDSALTANKKNDVDSIAVISLSKDSAYIFPLTNYASSLLETREAGDNNQVSEVTRQSDEKILYKLKIDQNALERRNVGKTPTAYMIRLMKLNRLSQGEDLSNLRPTSPSEDVFQTEFKQEVPKNSEEKKKTSVEEDHSFILNNAQKYPYKPIKFSTDYVMIGLNNNVLGTKYQKYANGSGPITLTSNNAFNGMIRLGISDVMENIKISGGFRLSTDLKDNDWLFQFTNLSRRLDWGLMYYRNVQQISFTGGGMSYPGKLFSNLYQANFSYPFSETRSLRLSLGYRRDKAMVSGVDLNTIDYPADSKDYGLVHLEYVYDNTLNPTQNIWDGVRYKAYADWNSQIGKLNVNQKGRYSFNFGFDGRVYYPIYRNFIWAGRAAGDFSWGDQKIIYYLGGIDNWFMFGGNRKSDGTNRYFNESNTPDPDPDYAFQSLAVNMRGYIQNASNGNNALVLNSEFRLPVFSTFFDRPINNAFLRNFQLIQFVDLGSAWNGGFSKIGRPELIYQGNDPTVMIRIKAPGIGPFLGGYGFGARSTLMGYFLKVDAGWPMNGFFKGKPIWYFSMGLDF